MLNVGPLELMVILIVALLVVGPSRLPEVGRSVGRGLREFRKAQDEVRATLQTALADEPPAARVNPPAPAIDGEPGDAGSSTGDDSDAEPTQGATTGSEAGEMARTLGRGLAELRRAREEIQRTFRVDLSDITAAPKNVQPSGPRAATQPLDAEPAEPIAAGQPDQADQDPPGEPAAAE